MSLTQEKPLENNFTNNNDHSYLHKKFKKMASSISVFPTNAPRVGETKHKEESTTQAVCNSLFSYGNIALSQEERQENQATYCIRDEKRVHTILFDDNSNNSDKNNLDRLSGQTSFTDELSNKTENLENDFTRDTHANNGTNGRYICPYCKLPCAKPSVLQKHIRAHTNERPYPCIPCGFAFKTKSNLYKHRRSRAHALKLQGADLSANDEEMSGGSESDSSLPTTSVSDVGSEFSLTRLERTRSTEFSSPDITSDRVTPPSNVTTLNENKIKMIYKPKFRAAFYPENEEKDRKRKNIPQNADFLTEHISKIISDNEAIVDVIETPLQKKYGKIKQIAESKLNDNFDVKSDFSPLNLTKNSTEVENSFRKRSHSESFSQNDPLKHPLNPEGSIIKDLLLKNKMNGMSSIASEQFDGPAVYICQLCQFIFRSADNLEIHRLYYCNPNSSNNIVAVNDIQKEFMPSNKRDMFLRSNSINVRLSETQSISGNKPNLGSTSHLKHKPDNILIIKPETNDVIAPLPSPGPLLGNTRLVDSRLPMEHKKIGESSRVKLTASPKRKIIDSNSDTYSPRLSENISPRATDFYQQSKIRCIESNITTFRSIEEISQHMRQNSTSLQMFGGEVKILDHSGGTTTLRIEPSKNQLSPILIQPTLSPSKLSNDAEASSVVVRSGLHSGGTMVHNPPTPKEIISAPHTPRISLSSTPGITNHNNMLNVHERTTHFQFPPFNAITAFNPLTLPPLSPSTSPNGATKILHGGKLIPHVPGIPGPNSQGFFNGNRNVPTKSTLSNNDGKISKELKKESNIYNGAISQSNPIIANKLESLSSHRGTNLRISQLEIDKKQSQNTYKVEMTQNLPKVPIIKVKNDDEHHMKTISSNANKVTIVRQEGSMKRNSEGLPRSLTINSGYVSDKSRNIDKPTPKTSKSLQESEIRNFNFESLITKAEIYNNQVLSSTDVQKNTNAQDITFASTQNERSETAYFQKNNTKSVAEDRKPKFLRPTSLPLKPGTFTPKKHHGITPNANTMPLISPETPRPAKAYGQLYLNGNAYTYLGLKCSTKVFYCTINRPQPTYVPNQHFLSMYSNWQLLSELTPDPLGLSASTAMSLYDSRHRPQNASIAIIKHDLILTHSSQWNKNLKLSKHVLTPLEKKRNEEHKVTNCDVSIAPKKELAGGFESNEEYTYVRGRGRGRYVCLECGIRCKKPSMLKKHIRTHTDVRPYTCIHCAFSFKTKGNLTKHMKSKAHYKKCCELGISPNEGNDSEGPDIPQGSGETDDDTESDGDEGNEGETESSDTEMCKSQLPEHEAARCLLSLGNSMQMTSATPGLITSARPSTYPYTPKGIENLFSDCNPEKMQECLDDSNESKSELDNEPIDLSKNDIKVISNNPEIPTARESSVLASLASNTAKLPQHQNQWTNGEPMLHTYLTERALLDTKIKQSQLTTNLSKTKKVELESPVYTDNKLHKANNIDSNVSVKTTTNVGDSNQSDINNDEIQLKVTEITLPVENNNIKQPWLSKSQNAENAKNVVSEYLKHARINLIKSRDDVHISQVENGTDISSCAEENSNIDDTLSEPDTSKPCTIDHDPIARKVVIGAGGVAFKVSKGKDYENSSYSPGRLMEDGRRVCDFCSKTFTKPSQLRLHLNIHYMERPFRCSACAVSFRTRGHLQKHERSGSHHNKVSMTSTFGAATSSNPRPFRCSDCNIAFRIHGHLAKHLRSKMHVMRLECLFKLPFGTFTEIERAGVSLTDIDTTDCESSLTSLQSLARKLHEKDPSKLEYRDPNGTNPSSSVSRELLEEDENSVSLETACDSAKSVAKTIEHCENRDDEPEVSNSATEKNI